MKSTTPTLAGFLCIVLLTISCKDKSVTSESQQSFIDTTAKVIQFKDQQPNVISVQLQYDSGIFSLDTIAPRSGIVTSLSPPHDSTSIDTRTFQFTLYKRSGPPYVTYVRVSPSMHTFEYEKKKDYVPHVEVKTQSAYVNVNIPLDTALIINIRIQEVVERNGVFVVPDSIKGRRYQEISISPSKK